MLIFYGYIFLIGTTKLALRNIKTINQYLTVIAGLLLFLISSLRHFAFGPDTERYVTYYYSLYFLDISELWLNFVNNVGQDPFFYMASKVINLSGADHQIWLAVIAATFCFAVSKIIYKYSDEAFLSFLMLISLGYLFFSFTGLRQTLALSMILLSYPYLRDRKLIPFILFVIFGSWFHSSALLFLIAYPIANLKIGWHYLVILSAGLIVSILYSDLIRFAIETYGWTDELAAYSDVTRTLSPAGFIIQLSIFILCLYYSKGVLKADNRNITLYNLLMVGLLFQLNTINIAEFFRLSMYFSIFSIILLTKAIHIEKDSNFRWAVNFAVYGALLAYFIRDAAFRDFLFYWQ